MSKVSAHNISIKLLIAKAQENLDKGVEYVDVTIEDNTVFLTPVTRKLLPPPKNLSKQLEFDDLI